MSLEQHEEQLERIVLPEKAPINPDHFLVHGEHTEIQEQHEQEVAQKIETLKHELHMDIQQPNIKKQTPPSPSVEKSTEKQTPLDVEKVVTNVTDFIPVVGSMKMILEGIRGKQYGTEKEITGKVRLLHGLSGAVFLALDVTGAAIIVSEFGKAGIKLSLRALEKETVEKIIESQVVKEEGAKLVTRGDERVKRKEELQKA